MTRFSPTTYNTVDPTANPDANGEGIRIESPNNLIGGTSPSDRNVIQGNSGSGIVADGDGSGNTIATDFILDNGDDGVLLLSANNRVGEANGAGLAGAGNLISGNYANGIHILGPSARANTVANDRDQDLDSAWPGSRSPIPGGRHPPGVPTCSTAS